MTNTLVSVFVPIGVTGAVIALACALVAAFAIARGAAGLAGGAIGVWIVGALLSVSASFASLWTPFFVAAIGLGVALIAGTVLRVVLAPLLARRAAAAERVELEAESAAAKAPAAASAAAPERAQRDEGRPATLSTDVVAVA
ncbi:MAG: hypothetical protein BGN97_12545 [Microbacterium sp. 69-10]|uniref:hypothetical protein n=1 Tax=Microbacterium sp. 69-10 TaxID=1895783 RepID=UPI00095D7BC8|nr:hypothetical protein [Microbacterium sp. 69-10]OJU38995.1 MAG: hypothetical protein BGN97_12545 [Microbacterium sp. 69-10]